MRTTIKEGKAVIDVDKADIASKELDVFYNPKMELNRSISILLLKSVAKKPLAIGLPLAGTGVRAVRFFKELPGSLIKSIACNDNNPKAVRLIKENLIKNNIPKKLVSVHEEIANVFLENSFGFDYVDIDPYGSPNFLLDSAMRRLSREGILAVTATDTGALAGSFVNAGKQKYWAKTLLCSQKHELGLRILARRVMLVGMSQAKALKPLLAYHQEHYYRMFFHVCKGKEASGRLFDFLTPYFQRCDTCGFHTTQDVLLQTCPHCRKKLKNAGPLYSGALQDTDVLKAMIKKNENKKLDKLLHSLLEENKLQVVAYYDTHELCRQRNISVKRVQTYMDMLKQKGFGVTTAATNSTAIKTDAPFDVVKKIIER